MYKRQVSITLNKEDSDYEELEPKIAEENREVLLQEIVSNTFSKYTYDEINTDEGQENVRNDMLEQMQELFDSDFIVAVNFSETNYQ